MSETRLRPFFYFFGSKWHLSTKYPKPQYDTIIEPFAGSAGYSLRYAKHHVILIEKDPIIAGTWQYLINASPDEIRKLPLVSSEQTVDDFDIPQEAKWFIGWWLNTGTATPCRKPSARMRNPDRPTAWWCDFTRERIASSLPIIRKWQIVCGDYTAAPDIHATWFIDPPYIEAGKAYRFGSRAVDYDNLAEWCKTRQGQVMVCENGGADWLPFEPFAKAIPNNGKNRKKKVNQEVLWYRSDQLSDALNVVGP